MAILLRPPRWGAQKPPAGAVVQSGHPLAAGLSGYWSLAEGGGRTLRNAAPMPGPGMMTLQGNVGWRAGPQGPSLAFPGSSGDYVTTPSWLALRSSQITVAVYARATVGATPGILASVNFDGNSVPFALHPGPTEFALQTAFSSYTGATGWVSATAGSDYRDGRWHLLVGTYDRAVLRLYIDGVLAGSVTQAGLVDATNTNPLDIGRYSTDYLTGGIGWVALWQRALPPAAVASLAAEPYALVAPPAPCLRYWGGVIAPGPQTTAIWNQRRVVYAPTRLV